MTKTSELREIVFYNTFIAIQYQNNNTSSINSWIWG